MVLLRYLLIFFAVSAVLRGLDPQKYITQYNIRVRNMDSGLPSNSIFALRQTKDGYLWIGTQDGLVRFDGINFQTYTKKNTPLKDNQIRALYEESSGALWIGTFAGGLTRFEQGEFKTYSIEEYDGLHKISAIDEDRWGSLWIGSITKGLTSLKNGKLTNYTAARGLPGNQVRSIYKDDNRDLWVTTNAGIVKLLEHGNFQVYASQDLLPYFKTVCLYKPDTKDLWIGTGAHGLYRFKNNGFSTYGEEEGIPGRPITYLYRDQDKNTWIGTDGGGLTRMNNGGISTLSGSGGLASGYISSIYEDRESSLWVGTLDGGLHQLRDNKFTTITTREGLAHDYVYCIREGRAGEILMGTREGLNLLKTTKGKKVLTTVPGGMRGPGKNLVFALCQDPDGPLWIGTWEGLHRMENNKYTTFTTKDGISDNRISSILVDSRGDTWVGTENGLNRLSPGSTGNKSTCTRLTKKQGLSSNSIKFIFEDSRGNLWVGTNAGLNRVKAGVINIYTVLTGRGKTLFRCVHEDRRGVLWFGTGSGLIRWNIKEKETPPFTYNVRDGLIENDIYSILEDENGYLWLAGSNGISRVKKKELRDFSRGKTGQISPQWYNEKDGLKSRWCTGAACKTRDGKFWFPTSMGAAVIDPNRMEKNPPPPRPIIEKITVDGEPINLKSNIKLAPGKNRLEFYYTAISFIKPDMRFKTMLQGYDGDWIDRGANRSTTYTGLSPGQYTFKVMVGNWEGGWNEKAVTFSFSLQPFFYQTAWFYFLLVMAVVLALFSLHRYRLGQLRTRQKELGQLVDKRTRELAERNTELEKARQKILHSKELIEGKNLLLQEQSEKLKELDQAKSRFFANISHEFRTPLTLIMGPLEQMLSLCRDRRRQEELQMMLRNSRRLLNLINQLLDLSKLESGKMKLRASRQNIIPFLKALLGSFNSQAVQNKLDLTFQSEEEEIFLYFDPQKLEDVIINLAANAMKFTPAGGKITVKTAVHPAKQENYPDGYLEITFSDTGIGIPVEQLAYVFDRFYQADGPGHHDQKRTGIGLALAKELVELHHGEIAVHSKEGKGSEFFIRLLLGDAHLQPEEIVETAQPQERKFPVLEESGPWLVGDRYAGEEKEKEQREAVVETGKPGKEEKPLVLVVEDNVDVRLYTRSSLEPHFKVVEAADGKEGILRAKEIIPDIIVSDVMMPETDGFELCRTLKKDVLTCHIPIILLTAKVSGDSVLEGLETGADDYITKPFSTVLLAVRIRNLIDLRRQLQLEKKNRMTLQPELIPVSPLDDEFYKKLQDTIETHLSDPDFNVETLSHLLQMSQATLYRKIHALTDKSPTLFLRSFRMKRAAQLLEANAGSVSEVAAGVGFPDKSYFARCFKEQFNRLPSDVRSSGLSGIDHDVEPEPGTNENNEKLLRMLHGDRDQWVSGSVGQIDDKQTQLENPLSMMPRPQPETDENQHQRFAQHIGPPRRGAPGQRGQDIILLVEDNEDTRTYIRQSLEPDYHVVEAVDGSEGMARAMEIIPDLVISDIMMSGMDGYELCRALKQDVRSSHIPIVLLTAKAAEENRIKGLELGADDYITKPFNTQIVRARIKNLIQLRRHLQEKRNREMTLLPVKISEPEIDREFMKELNAVIEKNLEDPEFNVEKLAKKLYLSSATLFRKIQAISGDVPSEYIRSFRLQRAARLLKENFGTVTEVAFEVGFKSRTYFTKCFKEKFHQLPSVYMAAAMKLKSLRRPGGSFRENRPLDPHKSF